LIVWGKKDKLIPIEYASSFMAAIRSAKFVEMPGCGHVPHVEEPKKFSEVVLRFLEPELVMNTNSYQ